MSGHLLGAALPSGGNGFPLWAYLLVGLVGITATYLGATYAARRANSGKVANSDASDLWEESRAIRQELRDRVVDLEQKHETCERRADGLQEQVTMLTRQVNQIAGGKGV